MFGTKLRRPPQCTTLERRTSLQALARHLRFQREGGGPRARPWRFRAKWKPVRVKKTR